jgi:hypothetical protein
MLRWDHEDPPNSVASAESVIPLATKVPRSAVPPTYRSHAQAPPRYDQHRIEARAQGIRGLLPVESLGSVTPGSIIGDRIR